MNNCVICIDTEKNGELCKPLKSIVSSETCHCDYSVHSSCLNEWMTKKDFKCLICGGHLKYKNNISLIYAVYGIVCRFAGCIFLCVICMLAIVLIMYLLVVIVASSFM